MTPLFKIKHGSYLYGTNTASSDIDFKTVYLPNLKDMLVGKKLEIYKERISGKNERTKADEVEEEFIPLQIFAQHFLKSQTYALELAFAYKDNNIHYFDPDYKELIDKLINDLISKFLTKNISEMVGYAKSQSLKYSLKGDRLGEIEKLISITEFWIKSNKEQCTNIGLAAIAKDYYSGNDTTKSVYITEMTSSRTNITEPALSIGNKLYALRTKLPHFLKAMKILKEKYGQRADDSKEGIDWKSVSHAIRIVMQSNELVTTGKMTFPVPDANLLLEIKNGKFSKEEAFGLFDKYYDELMKNQQLSILPHYSETMKMEFNEWLPNMLEQFYKEKL